jgi:hypothetical protein
MSGKLAIQGICIACKTGPTCVNAKAHVIWDCEQFEPLENMVKAALKKFVSERHHSDKYKGQCYYCEVQKTCTYPKPEGGAWECEEYR